jgi:hypothetical protein
MRRFLFFPALAVAALGAAGVLVVAACTSTATADRDPITDDSGPRIDGGLVGPAEAGAYDAGTPLGPEPNCAIYCQQVMGSCTGPHAQYASASECHELCQRLPAGDAGDTESNTLACRQYYAGSPARTSAGDYCLAAGPFGGGVCGDRCIAFCALTLGACAPDAGPAPYESYSACQTACAGYSYFDGGSDGGGEQPDGPTSGNSLNCRLFHVRSAVHDGTGCSDLGPDGGDCR